MKGKMLELKQWLKTSGKKIREKRELFKDHQRKGYETGPYNSKGWDTYCKNSYSLHKLRREYRHKHIAYSELRGRTRAQIEASYLYEGQSFELRPNEDWINRIKNKILSSACSQGVKAADSKPAIEGSSPSMHSMN